MTSVLGTPRSSASWLIHLPVPLAPAVSRILSTRYFAGLWILDAEDVAGDFDQVAVQFAAVPLGEDVVQLVVRQSERFFSMK